MAAQRNIFRRISSALAAAGVFLPSVVLVLILLYAFWYIGQGRDIVTLTYEVPRCAGLAVAASVFCAYLCWYSARLVGFTRPVALARSMRVRDYLPRMLGFSCFSVLAIAFLRPGALPAWGLFAASLLWFLVLERLSRRIAKYTAHARKPNGRMATAPLDPVKRKRVKWGFGLTTATVLLGVAVAFLVRGPGGAITGLVLAQAGYTVQVCCRRSWSAVLDPPSWLVRTVAAVPFLRRVQDPAARAPGRAPLFAPNELYYFLFFNAFSTAVLVLFVVANYSVRWAVTLGPMAIALIGLAVLLGSTNLLRLLARQWQVNLFFFGLVAIVVLGQFWDPHTVRTVQLDAARQERPSVTDRFERWLRARSAEVDSGYPVFLVLSDGGASRSGYWVASVLARLQAESGDRFGRHLFCLSGASGGSVGNATFLALLADSASRNDIGPRSRSILAQDMLSPALANMLGADMLHLLVPVLQGRDRAAALEDAFIHAGAVVDDSLFARPFERCITDDLPVFLINATRMQDAHGAVVANVRIDSAHFNGRLDILGRMAPDTAMRLATAVILGARFPYVSPAGQLIGRMGGRYSHDQYVDGGYFDNSGAGVTQELLLALRERFDSDPRFKKLDVHVLHITNGLPVDTVAHQASLPLLNDLAAPIITIAGAYGAQTDINDLRLARFMQRWYGDTRHYHTIDLYEQLPGRELSMNWAISAEQLQAMDSSVAACTEIGRVLELLRR